MNVPNSPADIIRPQTLPEAADRFTNLTDRVVALLVETCENPVWEELNNLLGLYNTRPLGDMVRSQIASLGDGVVNQMEGLLGHMAMHYVKDDWAGSHGTPEADGDLDG